MQKNNFTHLYKKQQEKRSDTVSKNTEIIVSFIFLFLLVLFIQYSPFEQHHGQKDTWSQGVFHLYFFIINQTLGMVHEAGHGVCYILSCPKFIMVINGTLFQIAFPLGIAYYYKRKKQYSPMLISLFFTGFSMQYTAWYISTSHEGAFVPAAKSFLGVDGYHDFNYILDVLGLLPYDSLVSSFVKVCAYLLMFYAVGKMLIRAFSHKA